jgi:hypothetical protein
MLSQKEGVYNAVVAFHSENGVPFEDGNHVQFSKEDRATVIGMICEAFNADEIELSESAQAKFSTPVKLRSYANGLVSNWLRKDVRMNGGTKYAAKNPGSRAGQGDETVKNLRLLKKTLTDVAQIEACDSEIASRLAEIKASKAPVAKIDYDAIPASLRETLGV